MRSYTTGTFIKPGARQRPVHAWFLEIDFVHSGSMRVCVFTPETINN